MRCPRPQLVSVVVPVLDEEAHIADQLTALASQSYQDAWELVVVDNGCTDRTIQIVQDFTDRLPSLTVADASTRRGLNHARNVGAAAGHGGLLAYCDGDDVVSAGWLASLVDAAGEADLVGGPFDEETLSDHWARGGLDPEHMTELPRAHGFLPYAPGGNCAVWASVARELGWDEGFALGSSDVEFSWRAQLAGYRLGFAPGAVVRRRYSRDLVRRNFAYGVSAPLLYRRFRATGMQRTRLQDAAWQWWWLLRSAPAAVRSPAKRAAWLRVAGRSVGRAAGSLRRGVLFP